MPVYVNARFLTQPFSGVQHYARTLSLALREKMPDLVFLTCREISHPDLAGKLNAVPIGRFKGPAWEQTELPAWLKKAGSPLLVNLCNTAPFAYLNQINTIHDLAFEQDEPWFSRRFTWYYRWLMPRVARNCRKLITVSRFSAGELNRIYGIPETSISVIPNSLSGEFTGLIQSDRSVVPETPYFLAAGNLDPRKNLKTVCSAFIRLNRTGIKLLIAGRKSTNFRDHGLLPEFLQHPRIEWLNGVSDERLVSLYKNARALINLSLYEGFGLNNLEAMACGCPLMLSDIPVFREVCAAAADYVPADDPAAAAGAMAALLDDAAHAGFLRKQGTERARAFDTEDTSALLAQEIKKLQS